jgi:hypothetical protein
VDTLFHVLIATRQENKPFSHRIVTSASCSVALPLCTHVALYSHYHHMFLLCITLRNPASTRSEPTPSPPTSQPERTKQNAEGSAEQTHCNENLHSLRILYNQHSNLNWRPHPPKYLLPCRTSGNDPAKYPRPFPEAATTLLLSRSNWTCTRRIYLRWHLHN